MHQLALPFTLLSSQCAVLFDSVLPTIELLSKLESSQTLWLLYQLRLCNALNPYHFNSFHSIFTRSRLHFRKPFLLTHKKQFLITLNFTSVQFSRSVVSDSWRPHEPQHTRPPCPSLTLRVHPNTYPLSQWCHPAISSSVIPFSSCLQSFPASGSFQMSQLFASGGQSTGVSASILVLAVNTQDWSPLGWTGWISLQSRGLSRIFSSTTVKKHQFFCTQLSL